MLGRESEQRAHVAAIATEWIGTPFHDHGEVKGPDGGVDCAKLLLCVFSEAGLIDKVDVGHYSPQFFLHQPEERFKGWVEKFAREVPLDAVGVGDIALYRIGQCFAHGAIVVAPGWPAIIHAHYAARRVRRGFGDRVHLGTPILDIKWFSLFSKDAT